MECQDREGCSLRAEQHRINMEPWLKKGQADFDRWCELPDDQRMLSFGEHALRRMVERALSSDAIRAAVEAGEVIERHASGQKLEVLVLAYIPVAGRKRWRPVHIKLASHRAAPAEMLVKTVYDPSTRPWQWAEDYRRRICWCGGDNE